MCLKVNTNFYTRKEAREHKPLIAEKDIKVYKVIDVNDRSPYFNFKYHKKYHYSCNFSKNIVNYGRWYIKINKGLHSFIKHSEAKIRKAGFLNEDYFKIVTMYIPKGSEYYLGDNGDIVSNNLVWY